jgi:adenylylsulfate kinase-like enzyme
MIVWLTGQPGSGKTTLCKQMMLNMGSDVFHIDGDDLRDLFDNKDYSEVGRRKNIELAQQISEYLHNKGKHVFVSLVSPYKDQRDKFKLKMGDNIIEVYVHTNEVRGREDFFVKDYQPPTENFIDIDTTNVSNDESKNIDDSANMILEFIKTN